MTSLISLNFNKGHLVLYSLLMWCTLVSSQVGVGFNSPSTSSALHVYTGNLDKGVMFPADSLHSLNATAPLPTNIVDGTLIYNNNTRHGKGYYFWQDSKWNRFLEENAKMAKFVNLSTFATASAMNLNSTTAFRAPLFGVSPSDAEFNDDESLYQPTDLQSVEVTRAGRYQVSVNLSMVVASASAEVVARLTINGIPIGPYYYSSEMDSNNGSSFGSINFTTTLELNSNDLLTISCSRGKPNKTGRVIFISAETSSFFIQQLIEG